MSIFLLCYPISHLETGGCPHAAIREDISMNMTECETLTLKFKPDLLIVESGGDNLAATFSRELADFIIYVIDVAGGMTVVLLLCIFYLLDYHSFCISFFSYDLIPTFRFDLLLVLSIRSILIPR
jgi:hypothetical protein